MKLWKLSTWCSVLMLTGLFAPIATPQLKAQQDVAEKATAPAENAEGVEVLTRGPIHEAFAGTISFEPEAGVTVEKAPPEAIEEMPPEQTVEGENVAWIPGYWAWDDERTDFLWISGVWRALPPGRQWVPGYWSEAEGGHIWTSGYWADAETVEVTYLEQPPESIDEGPNVEAPSPDQTWVPGTWVWQETRYVWRPGYWVAVQPNWVWIPAYYVWAPQGWVFIDGYYDYVVPRRGLLFAPVYFNSVVLTQPSFSYSPAVVINTNVFVNQLFVRPHYHHYYFGDYYATTYTSAGFYPSFSYYSDRRGYDPIFAYLRWEHRQDRNWERSVQDRFKERVENENARPPRTFADQQKLAKSGDSSKNSDLVVAASLTDFAKNKDSGLRLRAVKQEERQQLGERAKEIQNFRAERKKLEAAGSDATAQDPDKKGARPAMKLPKSPIVAKAGQGAGEAGAPPKAPEVPKVDEKAEPKAPKTARGKAADNDPSDPMSKTGSRPKGKSKTETDTDPDTDTKNTKPGRRPMPKTGNDPETKPGNTPGTKPGRKPENKPETSPKPEPKPKSEPKPEPKTKSEPKPERKPEPRPEPKPERKPEPKPEPKPETKPEPKPAPQPKSEPKPMPQPSQPKVEPKPNPMPAPKAEPAPKPKKAEPGSSNNP